jgi:hypothetical protein
MRLLISAMLVIVAVIHLLPLQGVLGPERLSALYGLEVAESNVEILLRHRAVLFGLFGLFFLVAALRPQLQAGAIVVGFASVVPFLVLAWTVGGYNAQVRRVVVADEVALACLVVAAGALWYLRRQA